MNKKYKYLFVLFFSILSGSSFAQEDFLSVYQRVNELFARHQSGISGNKVDRNDPAEMRQWSEFKSAIWDTVLMESKKIHHSFFPDILFKDIEGKDRSISEFNKNGLILNYNYYFCLDCINYIDTTVLYAKKNVNILVVLNDTYQKDLKDLKPYPANVILGTINKETADMISLRLGNDIYYYINKKGQVEFFRKMSQAHAWHEWRAFLKKVKND